MRAQMRKSRKWRWMRPRQQRWLRTTILSRQKQSQMKKDGLSSLQGAAEVTDQDEAGAKRILRYVECHYCHFCGWVSGWFSLEFSVICICTLSYCCDKIFSSTFSFFPLVYLVSSYVNWNHWKSCCELAPIWLSNNCLHRNVVWVEIFEEVQTIFRLGLFNCFLQKLGVTVIGVEGGVIFYGAFLLMLSGEVSSKNLLASLYSKIKSSKLEFVLLGHRMSFWLSPCSTSSKFCLVDLLLKAITSKSRSRNGPNKSLEGLCRTKLFCEMA